MEINNWKEFKVGGLFELERGKCSKVVGLFEGDTPYVGCTNRNNGVMDYYDVPDEMITRGNCICFIGNGNGSAGKQIYKKEDFLSSTGNVCGKNSSLNYYSANFIIAIMDKQQDLTNEFSHKNGRTLEKLSKQSLLLPATPSGDPDWDYMEAYMKEMEEKAKERLARLEEMRKQEKKRIDVTGWGEFQVGELFGIVKMRDKLTNKDIYIDGKTPVYSSTTDNNGIVGYTDLDADYIVNEKVERLVLFGDHTKSFFIAEESFCTMDNVKVLIPKNFNKYCIRYILTVWKAMIPDLGYSRHWNIAKNIKILLPVTSAGDPDWAYMEQYMREMEEKVRERLEKFGK